ncbi:MAG TPA: SET domain-containing protein-lysine N-methyltransferase [Chitinophagaceae bacterium]|nr:SET domain-containing protein-lysine N-methyltransferase [Chitinophagaceae bacterium]
MKICVLQPDYSTTGVDYKNYDPPRDLSALIPEAEVHNVFLNKLTTYKQLKELRGIGYDIFVNLCEGYLEWEVPSIDVIYTLELLNLPFTGPTTKLYDPPKELMKYLAYCEGIKTPGYYIVQELKDVEEVVEKLSFPLFVKPAKAGDSLGVDELSLVNNKIELQQKCISILDEYGPLLVEEYIAGREFTVLVAANPDGHSCTVFKPVEYLFPEDKAFKTYALKTSELHPDCNVPCKDPGLEKELRRATEKIFKGFNGVGYGRLDFRVDEKGDIYFLEINFTCSVFYSDGFEGSADYILKHDGIGQKGFIRHIIREGIARHQRKRKPFAMKGNSISGYGIYASRDITEGEIIFKGEGRSQRIITKRYVDKHWNEEEKMHFRRYAYPVSDELFILWDDDPSEWAPQNHCCEPNTAFDGLNVLALRSIMEGEELTLDYAQFLDENMEPFQCQCGSKNCRGLVIGIESNSLTKRETEKKSTDLPSHKHH